MEHVSVPSPRRRYRRIAQIAILLVMTAALAVTVDRVVIGSGPPLLNNGGSGGSAFWGGIAPVPGSNVNHSLVVRTDPETAR